MKLISVLKSSYERCYGFAHIYLHLLNSLLYALHHTTVGLKKWGSKANSLGAYVKCGFYCFNQAAYTRYDTNTMPL